LWQRSKKHFCYNIKLAQLVKSILNQTMTSSSSPSSSSAESSSSDPSSSSESEDEFIVSKTSKNQQNTSSSDPSKTGSKTNQQDGDDDDGDDDNIVINQKYAREYEKRKRREELNNQKKLHPGIDGLLSGDGENAVDDDDDDSSDESEDEEGELLTPQLDVQIVKTLKALKRKDGEIYDPNVAFFKHDDDDDDDVSVDGSGDKRGSGRKKKPKTYKDVVREQILEQMKNDEELGDRGDRSAEDGKDDVNNLAYDEEQRDIRRAFLESTRGSDDGDEKGEDSEDGDGGDWLKPKAKKSEADAEGDDGEARKLWEEELKRMKSSNLIDPKGEVQDGDQFLLDFMTHRKWLDRDNFEIKHHDDGSDEEGKAEDHDDDGSLEDLERMDAFESKYNFRFEEAAASADCSISGNHEGVVSGATHSIVHYARSSAIDDALRRKDETRRQKRLARKERKAEERRAKEEQLRRLKNAKREELEERIQQVRNVLGYTKKSDLVGKSVNAKGDESPAIGSTEEEMILKLMEGDYDPDKFEAVMNAAYGEEFYQKEDEEWKTDQNVKNDLSNGISGVEDEIMGDAEMYDEGEDEGEEEDDDDRNGDIEDEDSYGGDEWEEEAQDVVEPEIDQKLKSKMMDELYKLDYEDIIGDMPTRFKYRTVEKNDYGLSTEEILFAKDSTLKQFVSLKKLAPYRDEGEYLPGTKRRKRFRQMLKNDVEDLEKDGEEATNIVGAGNDAEDGTKKKKRRRQKKGSKKQKDSLTEDAAVVNSEGIESKASSEVEGAEKKSRRRKRRKDKKEKSAEEKDGNKAESTNGNNAESKVVPSTNKGDVNIVGDDNELSENNKKSKKEKKRKHSSHENGRKKKRKHAGVQGFSASRLASYGF